MDYMIQESDKKIWIVFTPGATISLNWPTTSKVGSPDDSTIYNFSHWDVYGGLNSVLHVDGMPYQPANQVDYVASILNGGANNSNLEITLPDYMESARVTITAHFCKLSICLKIKNKFTASFTGIYFSYLSPLFSVASF